MIVENHQVKRELIKVCWVCPIRRKKKHVKVRFLYQCSDHLSHSKNFTFLFPLIFLSKHISLYALGRIRWILDIIWPLNQHFKLKNQRNWLNQVWMWKFWNVMNCILLHWYKHLTLVHTITYKLHLQMLAGSRKQKVQGLSHLCKNYIINRPHCMILASLFFIENSTYLRQISVKMTRYVCQQSTDTSPYVCCVLWPNLQ